jgi:hypothetical protein
MDLQAQPLLLQQPLCWLWLQEKQARALLLAPVQQQQQQLGRHITRSMVMCMRSLCRSCACCCTAAASKVAMNWTAPFSG